MPTKRVFKPMQLYRGANDITPDLPLRRYKYIGSMDLSLSAYPVNSILKQKLQVSLKDAKLLRKLKVDEDAYIENKQIFEPYRKIALRHSQTLSSFSNYMLREDTGRAPPKILKIIGKLKSMSRYKSFALSFRELYIAQRSLKSIDLMSSKFIKEDFKKLLYYLLNSKFSFPWIEKLAIISRLSREKENIIELLPSVLDCPKFKEIGLSFLYAKELPDYNDLAVASRRKVKDLVLLTDDGYNVTSTLPVLAAFDGLRSLSISNPFRGFKIDENSCKNWKIMEKLPNLKTFSLELSNEQNPAKFALLLSSLRWPRQLEQLTLLFHSVPLEGLIEDYPMHLTKFLRMVSKLGNLSVLNLKFESENLRGLPEIINMLCTALARQEKLKEVFLAFPEPRYRTTSIKNNAVMSVGKLFSALNRSAKTLTKLCIVGVKGELSEFDSPISFRALQEVSISLDEKMDTSNKLDTLFDLLGANNLKKLELNFRTPAVTQDILSLERLRNVEYLKISVLGEMIAEYIMILRAVLLNSYSLREIWLDFPDLDVREENRIEDMIIALKNKKKIRRIKIGTKYLKYSFDRNVDSNMKEQASNEHKTMIRFVL